MNKNPKKAMEYLVYVNDFLSDADFYLYLFEDEMKSFECYEGFSMDPKYKDWEEYYLTLSREIGMAIRRVSKMIEIYNPKSEE